MQVKNEQCMVMRTKNDGKMVLTSADEIGLKEWSSSLRTAHKCSFELLSSLAKKAGKIYGTENSSSGASAAVQSTSGMSSNNTISNPQTTMASHSSANWSSESGCRRRQRLQSKYGHSLDSQLQPSPDFSSRLGRVGNKWLQLKKRVVGRSWSSKSSTGTTSVSSTVVPDEVWRNLLIAAAAATPTTPLTPPPPPLPDSSTSSASFFAVPKCKKKKLYSKTISSRSAYKNRSFFAKIKQWPSNWWTSGPKPPRLVRCHPHLPPATTNDRPDLWFTFLPFLGRTYEYFSRRYTLHHHEFLCTVWWSSSFFKKRGRKKQH